VEIKIGSCQSKRNNTKATQKYNPHGLMSSNATESIAPALDYLSVTTQSSNLVHESIKNEATVGRKVKHGKFGIGTIVSISNSNGDTLISIAFDNMGIKKLVLDKAPIEML
jgi:DNA helicase-2/ATP-dependent DNA helicase PcrA